MLEKFLLCLWVYLRKRTDFKDFWAITSISEIPLVFQIIMSQIIMENIFLQIFIFFRGIVMLVTLSGSYKYCQAILIN